ncbi:MULTISPECIES: hypothetical protein [unclassified Carboxylicivirga]|uniref:hypothetical protein n=1 Tax=Carboxylicivirga TaxID=1628153 RepID=UPI003D34B57F
MTKNEMTTAMFEEIKEKMALMDEKLDDLNFNQEQARATILDDIEQRKKKTLKIEYVVDFILDSMDGVLNASTDKLSKENKQVLSKIDEQANALVLSMDEMKRSLHKRKLQTIKIFAFQVLFAIAASFCFYLIYENQNLRDSDLQLRYLKATNNIDMEVAGQLDTVFNVYRDEEAIESIKQAVNSIK